MPMNPMPINFAIFVVEDVISLSLIEFCFKPIKLIWLIYKGQCNQNRNLPQFKKILSIYFSGEESTKTCKFEPGEILTSRKLHV